MAEREDIRQDCADCGKPYTTTVGAQEFYLSKGMELPRRCKECRNKRNAFRREAKEE